MGSEQAGLTVVKPLKLLTVSYGTEEYVEERRKFERFTLKLPAKVETMTSGQHQSTFDLSTINVSAGGALLPAEEPIPKGITVKMNLIVSTEWLKDLTGSQGHLEFVGKVVRCDSNGMAIRFDKKYRFTRMIV